MTGESFEPPGFTIRAVAGNSIAGTTAPTAEESLLVVMVNCRNLLDKVVTVPLYVFPLVLSVAENVPLPVESFVIDHDHWSPGLCVPRYEFVLEVEVDVVVVVVDDDLLFEHPATNVARINTTAKT
jgi:hypothetical protein